MYFITTIMIAAHHFLYSDSLTEPPMNQDTKLEAATFKLIENNFYLFFCLCFIFYIFLMRTSNAITWKSLLIDGLINCFVFYISNVKKQKNLLIFWSVMLRNNTSHLSFRSLTFYLCSLFFLLQSHVIKSCNVIKCDSVVYKH